jgi:hypothetical protein
MKENIYIQQIYLRELLTHDVYIKLCSQLVID